MRQTRKLQSLQQIVRIRERIFPQRRMIKANDGIVIRTRSVEKRAAPRRRAKPAEASKCAAESTVNKEQQARRPVRRQLHAGNVFHQPPLLRFAAVHDHQTAPHVPLEKLHRRADGGMRDEFQDNRARFGDEEIVNETAALRCLRRRTLEFEIEPRCLTTR